MKALAYVLLALVGFALAVCAMGVGLVWLLAYFGSPN